jgi:CopG antitoxin of type II toxin-antitoxin system
MNKRQQTSTPVPKFKSYEEKAAWYDNHDLSTFWDELTPVDIDFQLKQPKEENIVVRLQKPVKDRLDQVARGKGLNVSSLTRMWILERLNHQR